MNARQNKALTHYKLSRFFFVSYCQLNSSDAQLQYELCFCLWILTFDANILEAFVDTQATHAICEQGEFES